MGEIQERPFQLSFNASLKVEFQGSRVTSEVGIATGISIAGAVGIAVANGVCHY
jgi:hypothetical protein